MANMKKKRVSKRNKKSWRKNVDVSDVDAFLDNKRLDERLGGPISALKNEDIFSTNNEDISSPAKLVKKDDSKTKNKISGANLKLKCFQPLENDSKVKDPVKKRNRLRTKEERRHPIAKREEIKRKKIGILKKKEVSFLQKMYNQRCKKLQSKSKTRVGVSKDLWIDDCDGSGDVNIKLTNVKDWLGDNTILHTIRNTKGLKNRIAYRPPKNLVGISPFDVPHPGTSYNPTYGDHQKLLEEVAAKEEVIEKRERHLERVTSKLFTRVTRNKSEAMWMEEMCQGLPVVVDSDGTLVPMEPMDIDEDPQHPRKNISENKPAASAVGKLEKEQNLENSKSDSECESDSGEYKAINPPVTREKKKTVKQKKKQLRLKKEQQEREMKKEQRAKALDICKVKRITREVQEEEEMKLGKMMKRLAKRVKRAYEPQRVGRNKLEMDGHEEFATENELCGSLREITPHGNILKDRMRNMQMRSLIEITRPQFKRLRAKKKKFSSESHKLQPTELSRNEVVENMKKTSKTKKKPFSANFNMTF